ILLQDRNIKKDPFGIEDLHREYTLNKKKRWLIPQILGENIESYQNPELNLKVSLVTTTLHWAWNVTKYTGYSQIEQKTLTKTAKNLDRPDDLFNRDFWSPSRPKPSFDKNDIYDYETCPIDDFLPFEENENIDPLIRTSTPTYRLEDFIVNKQEKERRKKKVSRKISDFEIFSKTELKEAILEEKRVSQETRENPETRCRVS
uniref:Protein TIC 214 n=1 Tax=Acrobeloides nanus TaxID=290746 RepID=A0A914CPX3_9BILA